MTIFYLGSMALVVFGLVFAVWPFIRRPKGESLEAFTEERQATNIASFRDHIAEVEAQFKQGHIDQEQYDETKAELERSLLEDNADVAQTSINIAGSKTKLVYWLLVFVALPVMVLVIYKDLGFKDSVILGDKLAEKKALEEQWFRTGDERLEAPLEKIKQSLIVDLENHIKRHPDDLDSHVLLAREAMSIGLYDKAIETYQTILEQQPEAAQMMAELAQVVFIQAGNRAVPIVGMLAERAIQLQPDHLLALGLAGISAFQNTDYAKAIQYWQRAITLQPQDSPDARALVNGIEQARARLGESDTPLADATPQTAGQVDNAEAAAEPSLTVTVSVDEKVTTTQNAAVFIYARAWQGARVPLAISRVTVADLPLTIELTNAMAMAPGMNLSTVEEVELIARVSESGTAIAQAGDWQTSIGPVNVLESGDKVFEMVIDTPYSP